MGRRLISMLAFALALTSCTAESGSESTTTPPPESTSTSTTAPPSIEPGKLAIVDDTGNIAVMDPDGSKRQAVTDVGGDDRALFTQPIWSPDGSTLAWGQATGTGFGVGISQPGTGDILTLTTPNLPFYNYWSPDSRHLGVLHNGETGVQFQMVDVAEETASMLDEDTPFYFSWSPEGDRVVTHAGADRVETIRPDGEREELEPTAGTYLAPQWTPNGTFHVVDDRVVLEDETGSRAPVVVVSGITMFVANMAGTRVALQSSGEGGPVTASSEDLPSVGANSVAIIEVASGRTVTPSDQLAAGFFWSPDGDKLLILTVSDGGITPLVWTADDTAQFPGYSPAPAMVRDTFPFFPQYAQSVSFWAPDSSAFAYAGDVEGEAGIWIQSLNATAPRHIADGTWVAWSSGS